MDKLTTYGIRSTWIAPPVQTFLQKAGHIFPKNDIDARPQWAEIFFREYFRVEALPKPTADDLPVRVRLDRRSARAYFCRIKRSASRHFNRVP
jgi:hypothetical protein